MTGLQYIAAGQFTGERAATLPVILHDLPVAGYARRFVANAVRQPVGSTVAAWKDSAGSGTSLVPVSSQAPTLGDDTGIRSVIFNGTNQGLQQSVALPNPNTLVLVAKIIVPNTTANNTISGAHAVSNVDAARLELAVSDLYVNAGTGVKVGTGLNSAGWRVYVVNFNGASTIVNINGTEYTMNAGTLPRAVFTLGFARGSGFANIAVAEAVLYSGDMNTASRAATVAALREEYGF